MRTTSSRRLSAQRASEVEREVLIESPYFVLGDATIERVRQLTARGVKVRVLTNSAASHDVLPALAGYVYSRKKLLNAGVELYELRPDTNMHRDWSVLAGKSHAALHAKSLVFDRKSVFIGSFNLDPRSTGPQHRDRRDDRQSGDCRAGGRVDG